MIDYGTMKRREKEREYSASNGRNRWTVLVNVTAAALEMAVEESSGDDELADREDSCRNAEGIAAACLACYTVSRGPSTV